MLARLLSIFVSRWKMILKIYDIVELTTFMLLKLVLFLCLAQGYTKNDKEKLGKLKKFQFLILIIVNGTRHLDCGWLFEWFQSGMISWHLNYSLQTFLLWFFCYLHQKFSANHLFWVVLKCFCASWFYGLFNSFFMWNFEVLFKIFTTFYNILWEIF